MSGSLGFGNTVAREFITDGNTKPLRQLIDDVNSDDPALKRRAHSELTAAMATFSRVLQKVSEGGGVTFTGEPLPGLDEALYAVSAGPARLSRVLQLQINAIAALRKAAPGYCDRIKITPGLARAAEAAPTPVSVVSMPTRVSTTDIGRNMAGEIVSSMQVEKDF